jgi:hypothetical protein
LAGRKLDSGCSNRGTNEGTLVVMIRDLIVAGWKLSARGRVTSCRKRLAGGVTSVTSTSAWPPTSLAGRRLKLRNSFVTTG